MNISLIIILNINLNFDGYQNNKDTYVSYTNIFNREKSIT